MRKAVIFGGILLSIGHILMAVEGFAAVQYEAGTTLTAELSLTDGSVLAAGTLLTETIKIQDLAALNVFYFALAFFVMGVGFLKPNISTILGQHYGTDDPRRDSGFTIFYMGINVGAFAAALLCGWLGETFGWKYGFGAAGIGMIVGLITFITGQKHLRGLAEPKRPKVLAEKILGPINREWTIYLSAIAGLVVIWFLVQSEPVVHLVQNTMLVVAISGLLIYSFFTASREEFQRMLVLMVLICSTVVFWALFEQSSASMTLYADRVMDRSFAGGELRASQFGSLNAGFIMLLAIPFAGLWVWLSKRGWEPSTPAKFGLGIIQAGLGFGMLVIGAKYTNEAGQVAMIWLVLAYLLHTTGELCLSPVGLSAVTKLSLQRVVGMTMGVWFLATALSETVATRIGKAAAIDTSTGEAADVATMLAQYTELYEFLMYLGVGVGIFMLLITPLLRKGMHGIH
jgi:POT family proton-dependent oligopeptide transporter